VKEDVPKIFLGRVPSNSLDTNEPNMADSAEIRCLAPQGWVQFPVGLWLTGDNFLGNYLEWASFPSNASKNRMCGGCVSNGSNVRVAVSQLCQRRH
jgi:hypothetical protein